MTPRASYLRPPLPVSYLDMSHTQMRARTKLALLSEPNWLLHSLSRPKLKWRVRQLYSLAEGRWACFQPGFMCNTSGGGTIHGGMLMCARVSDLKIPPCQGSHARSQRKVCRLRLSTIRRSGWHSCAGQRSSARNSHTRRRLLPARQLPDPTLPRKSAPFIFLTGQATGLGQIR